MRWVAMLGVFLACVSVVAASAIGWSQDKPIRVAMVAYLFDEDKEQVLKQMRPFIEKVQGDTGSRSEFVVVDDLATLATDLKEDRVQVAILPGLDFAWLRREQPTLEPLLVAAVDGGQLRAVTLTADEPSSARAALARGSILALPRRCPQHVRFYLEREVDAPLDEAFKLKEFRNVDDALDAVIDGQAEAVCVSMAALKVYGEQKPGRRKKLKILAESVDFPAPVVAYQSRGANAEQLRKFSEAMKRANQTAEGRQTLTLWRLKGFEALPPDYTKQLEAILAQYPGPQQGTKQ